MTLIADDILEIVDAEVWISIGMTLLFVAGFVGTLYVLGNFFVSLFSRQPKHHTLIKSADSPSGPEPSRAQMHECGRCRREFTTESGGRLSLVLQILSFPMMLPFLLRSPSINLRTGKFTYSRIMQEYLGAYCRPCRRQMNFALAFWASLLLIVMVPLMLKQWGLFP